MCFFSSLNAKALPVLVLKDEPIIPPILMTTNHSAVVVKLAVVLPDFVHHQSVLKSAVIPSSVQPVGSVTPDVCS